MKTKHTLKTAGHSLARLFLVVAAFRAVSLSAQVDLGPEVGTEIKNVSLSLKLHDRDKLEAFINSTVTAGSPQFHQFLTVDQFTARYCPSAADVQKVVKNLQASGIQVNEISANRLLLKTTGTVDAYNRYFATNIHQFAKNGRHYHAPVTLPQIPAAINGSVIAVAGLSDEAVYHTHHHSIIPGEAPAVVLPSSSTATGVPGTYTVGDVANFYQINPLYKLGISGKGRTIGIATLATFDQNDAYGYWSAIGLKVKANRITEVAVDGGAGPDGADETTLDVQQSGGLAPKADIIVYEGPNTDQGFLDIFVAAVIQNKVDTLSVSWGLPEIATDPNLALAQDQIFLEAAAQGISMFASTGDAGAYDINADNLPFIFPFYTQTLTVDSPSSSPYITGAGGITLAGLQQHKFGTVNVPHDRAWGWDYLQNYFDTNYADLGGYFALAFPVGGGGGVSVNEDVPRYQRHVKGVQKSAPGQSLIFFPNYPDTSGAEDLADLPAGFAGRNLPDVSLNADPYTGYLLYFGGVMYAGNGGTSFVAPQLNGIASLLGEVAHGRIGFLNPTFYRMQRHTLFGFFPAFTDITSGDNLFYKSVKGYNPATGLGSINTANVALRILLGEIDDD